MRIAPCYPIAPREIWGCFAGSECQQDAARAYLGVVACMLGEVTNLRRTQSATKLVKGTDNRCKNEGLQSLGWQHINKGDMAEYCD